mmetsp:Transcript_42553/g.77277  ORF Transcript_42553/g.77277 Transcript_42553/m.77277 type:complete len:462 (-) Transcript_42553:126-1511(-)
MDQGSRIRGLQQPLLPAKSAGSRPSVGPTLVPFFLINFIRMTAFAVAMLPAFTLRVNEFMSRSGYGLDAAATAVGTIVALRHLTEFIATPMLSTISDTTGRRPVMLASCLAFVIETASLACAPNLTVFAAIHVIGGLFSTSNSVEASCIADATAAGPARAVAMGRFLTVIGAAVAVGPAIGGAATKALGGSVPFMCASALGLLTLICEYFFLPEYLSKSQREAAKKLRQRSSIERILPILGLQDLLRSNTVLIRCAAASILSSLGMATFASTSSLWMKAAFGWEGQELGRFLSVMGCAVIVSQVFVLPWLLSIAKGQEVAVAQATLMLMAAKYLCFALAPSGQWIYVVSIVTLPSFCSISMLSSMSTRHVPPTQQGLWSGGMSALGTAAQAVGSMIGSRAFAATVQADKSLLGLHLVLPILAYLLSALCIARAGASGDSNGGMSKKCTSDEATPTDLSLGA